MPIISYKTVKARKPHTCDWDHCLRSRRIIEPGQIYVRLYGYAERGDKPYVVRLHVDDPGAMRALSEYQQDRARARARKAAG